MNYLLFNSQSSSNLGEKKANEIVLTLKERFQDIKLINLIGLDTKTFIASLTKEDVVIISGGDGTLNHFINDIDGVDLPCLFYLACSGTGNDFAEDIGEEGKDESGLIKLNELMHNLPCVEVNGKTYRFFNGVGLGIDGDTCVEANNRKKAGKKHVSYSAIVLGLVLKGYKAPSGTISLNGKELHFSDAYMTTAMKGRYFGGGIKIAPTQDRHSDVFTVVCAHCSEKAKVLPLLTKITSGKHTSLNKYVFMEEAKEVYVKFDEPHGLQFDGETIENVTEFRAYIK